MVRTAVVAYFFRATGSLDGAHLVEAAALQFAAGRREFLGPERNVMETLPLASQKLHIGRRRGVPLDDDFYLGIPGIRKRQGGLDRAELTAMDEAPVIHRRLDHDEWTYFQRLGPEPQCLLHVPHNECSLHSLTQISRQKDPFG